MMRRIPAAWMLLVALTLPACSDGDPIEPYRPPGLYRQAVSEGGIARGRELYLRDCAFCHGNRGAGTDRGPDLISGTNGPAMLDFMLSSGRMPIQSEHSDVERDDPVYTSDEIADIVAYVDIEFDPPGPRIPQVSVTGASLALGQQLYQENCAACHAPTGIGGALVSSHDLLRDRVIIPGVGVATPREVAEAIRVGPGSMPVFGSGTLSDADLDAVVAYVDYLQSPEDRGGTAIGRIGPVAEGAVGWILGMGLIVVIISLIGTTTRNKR